MQAKDITDDAMISAIKGTASVLGTFEPAGWRMRWHVRETLEAEIGKVPEKVFLAKAKRLIARGLIHGCDCGCRGDYHLPEGCHGC
jgi:hypothetical protein